MRRAAVILALALCGACSSSGDGTVHDAHAEIHAACSHLARVYCEAAARCTSAAFSSRYGDSESCVERRTLQCERSRFGAGSKTQPADVEACAAARDVSGVVELDQACATWLEREVRRVLPGACTVRGQLFDGASCLDDSQCASGACLRAVDCGTCGERQGEGGVCFDDTDCEGDLACKGGHCARYQDETCSDAPCNPELVCVSAKCVPRSDVSCASSGEACALWPEQLECSGAGSCQPYQLRALGEICDAPLGSLALCQSGAYCKPGNPSRCLALIEDGQSCDQDVLGGGPCRAPAVCFRGRCAIPDAAACSELPQ